MITVIEWIAALVASLTSLAMLSDSPPLQAIWRRATAIERIRYVARGGTLVLIAASSSVCVLMPLAGGGDSTAYDAMLRCALAAFMAMQAPCPWFRWVLFGERRGRRRPRPLARQEDRHVH